MQAFDDVVHKAPLLGMHSILRVLVREQLQVRFVNLVTEHKWSMNGVKGLTQDQGSAKPRGEWKDITGQNMP